MGEREPSEEDVVGAGEDVSAPLSRAAQIGAGAVGVGLTGAGAVAVFISSNQAGTVALVLAGAIFLLMMFGGAPLHSLGFGEANLRFARKQQVVKDAIDSPADQAPRVLRNLESIDNRNRPDPTVSALTERVYEDALAYFFASRFPQNAVLREKPVGAGRRVDMAVDFGSDRQLVVEARYSRGGSPLSSKIVDVAASYYTLTQSPVLIVSNSSLSKAAADHLRALQESGADVHFVQWLPDGDDAPLRHAVQQLMHRSQ